MTSASNSRSSHEQIGPSIHLHSLHPPQISQCPALIAAGRLQPSVLVGVLGQVWGHGEPTPWQALLSCSHVPVAVHPTLLSAGDPSFSEGKSHSSSLIMIFFFSVFNENHSEVYVWLSFILSKLHASWITGPNTIREKSLGLKQTNACICSKGCTQFAPC